MNSNTFRLAALAVAAAPVAALVAVPAQAAPATTTTTGGGKASAVVLRTALDVSLLNKTVDVPLKVTLNEVQAPRSAEQTALSVRLDGVDHGKPVNVLKADVATAKATADKHRAAGYSNLANARVSLPGLTMFPLLKVEKVTSKAVCEAGSRPVAEANVLGYVSVLGKRVTLTAGGTTRVAVPKVGEVTLDLSKTETTSRTAAAVALQLKVSVNPLDLNVADVKGEVTLAEATCETPKGHGGHTGGGDNGGGHNGGGDNGGNENGGNENGGNENGGGDNGGNDNGGATGGGSTDGGSGNGGSTSGGDQAGSTGGGGDVKTQTGTDQAPAATDADLAETGSSSSTPYIAGGAALLLAAGAGAMVLTRRRARG
ncbi:SCO1860 family LAETG-anchored protein [Streptomyces drozdowiczii]|uniref:LPXTG cell wall anchor domain-containing protein n=1 Tax=Streptomyces drozdowiczii TaxID=202862 RepID=A0ABY6PXU9_9ACTN|nr:SCO1860 family LAETG-anchored protein [Streptomyces drozdowiczii]MCX0243157.1 LPXTG cell wall anchor domain-containing protein [Streptomyces drozdowiczii]UZK56875.1 LPXTG cell wall anchor domain-containing protein [Streptomyces drozdowiczii]